MGFPYLSIIGSAPKLILIKLTASDGYFFLVLLNHFLILIISHLILRFISILSSHLLLRLMIMSKPDHNNEDDHHDHDPINRPSSASLVPVPPYVFAESAKKRIPVMPYKIFLEKNGGEVDDIDDKGCVCIICLNKMEESHEVRVPFNCCHVFHKDCLDVWVDQGKGTCPLCRSKLLPTQNHHHDSDDQADRDPWRRERMIYIFGDDFLFEDD